jgi:predicted ATPase/DNA-binding SARP family transcriptional activator
MEFHILGPLEVIGARERIELSAALERALLQRLLLDANRPVSVPQLIDDLWAGKPPRTALRTLRVYVSRLRHALEDIDRITTTAGGYRLRVEPGECDSERFETLAEAGRLTEALALWRGPALAEVADTEWARIEAARLEESRLTVLEQRLREDLAAGGHAAVVPELEALCAREPLREGLWASLMLALYRSGRQAAALAAYARLRSHLVHELGLEPSTDLRTLQDRILATDPGLDLMPAPIADALPGPAIPLRGNVSSPRTSFIPGSLDPRSVAELLSAGRSLTLVGPPGAGKTRLATELAVNTRPDYPAGTWLIELAGLADGDLLAERVADVLGVGSDSATVAIDALIAHFSHSPGLLVLDNCEHLTAACARLAQRLTSSCPSLALVCTSRERLGIDDEMVCTVPLLAVPDRDGEPTEILRAPACRLFIDRAAVAGGRPDLNEPETADAVAEICRRLDGLPLALELAAARTGVLSPVDLVARLDDGLELLRSRREHLPERQRTLRALLEWSHSTLDERERRLLRRLTVLASGASLDAVEHVCTGPDLPRSGCVDALESLAERSLIVADTAHGRARYRLLETIRLYALEQLREAGEEPALRERHAHWCIEFANGAQRLWFGGDQQQAARQLTAEQDNWRTALNWLISCGDGLRATELAAPLGQWWYAKGRTGEGRAMLEQVLALSAPPSHARATVLRFAGALARTVGDIPAARRHIADGVAIADAIGDRQALLQLQISLAATTWLGGEPEASATILAQALDTADALGDRQAQGNLSYNLAVLARNAGEMDEALARITTAGQAWSDAGDLRGVALSRGLAASVQLRRGAREEARELVADALRMLSGTDFAEAIVEQIETVAALDTLDGNYTRAARLLGHAQAVRAAEQLIRPPVDETEVKQMLVAIHQRIGGQLDAELAAGSQLSLDEAIGLGLGTIGLGLGPADPDAALDLSAPSTPARASQRTR